MLMTAARTGDAASIRALLVRGCRSQRPRPLPRPDGADVGRLPEQRGCRARPGRAGWQRSACAHRVRGAGGEREPAVLRAAADRVHRASRSRRAAATSTRCASSLQPGADINDTLSDGQSALVVAVANANWELADYMLDRGRRPEPGRRRLERAAPAPAHAPNEHRLRLSGADPQRQRRQHRRPAQDDRPRRRRRCPDDDQRHEGRAAQPPEPPRRHAVLPGRQGDRHRGDARAGRGRRRHRHPRAPTARRR